MNDFRHEGGSADERIELGRLFGALWRRKGLIVLTTIVGFVVTFFLMIQIAPKYTARATVLLDPRTIQVLSSNNVVADVNLNDRALDTEVAVLTSNMLLERVIAGFDPKKLEVLDPVNRVPSVMSRLRATVGSWSQTVRTRILGPSAEEPPTVQDEEARRIRRLTAALKSSLSVRRVGDAYLISVMAETESPNLSAGLANSIVETYIEQQLEQTTEAIRKATRLLQDRVAETGAAVEAAEKRIEDFRSSELAKSGASLDTVERQLQDLSTQLALAQADLAQAQARYDQIKSVVDTQGIGQAAELLSSPLVLSLREQLSAANRRDLELSARYAADHPDRLAAARQIERLEQDLEQEVRQIVARLANDVEVARIRTNSLQANVREMELRAADLSRAGLELRQLEREADALRENYQSMLNRLNETQSTEQLQTSIARQIERAAPPGGPSSPRVMLFTAFGGTVGFSFGVVVAFFLVVSGAGFRTAHDVEEALGLPVLAILPKLRGRSTRAILRKLKESPYQPMGERLRQLRMALLSNADQGAAGTCVMLTSATADEGKTFTTTSLAMMEALSGRKCVVLDFDLRRSRMAVEFAYSAKSDLADVLRGRSPIDDAIQTLPDVGFDLITLKEPGPHLADEIDDARLRQLIADLRQRYQTVLIDTGPVLLVSDAFKLAPHVDEVLLLVRQNETRRRLVTEAMRNLEDLGARSISVVITLADPRLDQGAYGDYTP